MNINKELLHELAKAITKTYMYADNEEIIESALQLGLIEKRRDMERDEVFYAVRDLEDMVKQIESKAEPMRPFQSEFL